MSKQLTHTEPGQVHALSRGKRTEWHVTVRKPDGTLVNMVMTHMDFFKMTARAFNRRGLS